MKFKALVIGSVFALASMASVGSSPAQASDGVKFGVVDMQRAIQSVEAGKKAKAQLEKEFNAKKKSLQDEEAAIKKLGEEFKKQSLVMNDEARAKKQAELQERVMKFQELQARSQMELQQKEGELLQPIVNRLRGVIGELAKQRGYSLVLEKNENMVLFSQDKDDLTKDAIDAYNKAPKS
ncbi:MAG: OmpH family outer membrane protein [Oligoflexia bacterium]|nr:OmpH family outer membrane protein [Oligoflexia bacterium]